MAGIIRYYTLKQSNKELMRLVQEQEAEVDDMRGKLDSLRVEQENQLLVRNSYLQSLQKELETVLARGRHEEEEKNIFEDSVKHTSREVSQVVQSIKNTFTRCQSTMRNPGRSTWNNDVSLPVLSSHLEFVESRLVDLIEVEREFHMREKMELDDGDYNGGPGRGLEQGSASTTMTGKVGEESTVTGR